MCWNVCVDLKCGTNLFILMEKPADFWCMSFSNKKASKWLILIEREIKTTMTTFENRKLDELTMTDIQVKRQMTVIFLTSFAHLLLGFAIKPRGNRQRFYVVQNEKQVFRCPSVAVEHQFESLHMVGCRQSRVSQPTQNALHVDYDDDVMLSIKCAKWIFHDLWMPIATTHHTKHLITKLLFVISDHPKIETETNYYLHEFLCIVFNAEWGFANPMPKSTLQIVHANILPVLWRCLPDELIYMCVLQIAYHLSITCVRCWRISPAGRRLFSVVVVVVVGFIAIS